MLFRVNLLAVYFLQLRSSCYRNFCFAGGSNRGRYLLIVNSKNNRRKNETIIPGDRYCRRF
jgi:hypothetical protein